MFLALGALTVMAWGSAGSASATEVLTLDLTHSNPDLVFQKSISTCPTCGFSPGGDAYVSYSAAGATLGDPAKSAGEGFRSDLGALHSTFTALGDFTATVTFDATLLNQSVTGSGVFGPATAEELDAEFGGGANAIIGQNGHANGDTTIGVCLPFGSSPTCSQTHTDPANDGLGQVMTISRVGDVVTMAEGPSSLPDAEVFQGSGFDTGPVSFALTYASLGVFTGADISGPDSITFKTFSITADGFAGLAAGVPEPGAWTLMIAGLFGLGFALRSQRARQANAIPA
jgi:hypothetical protein